jgi:hypothetical protein
VAVLPAYRRRGIGHQLLEAAIQHAQLRGATVITLEVIAGNTPAYQLYRQRGFEHFNTSVELVFDQSAAPVLDTLSNDCGRSKAELSRAANSNSRCRPTCAMQSEAAAHRQDRSDFDYYLSDIRGDALASAIKGVSSTTKVMHITADVELDAEAGWANVDRCLIKPFPMRDLVAAVSTLLPSNAMAR